MQKDSETNRQRDRHTYMLITILCPPTGGNVTTRTIIIQIIIILF